MHVRGRQARIAPGPEGALISLSQKDSENFYATIPIYHRRARPPPKFLICGCGPPQAGVRGRSPRETVYYIFSRSRKFFQTDTTYCELIPGVWRDSGQRGGILRFLR